MKKREKLFRGLVLFLMLFFAFPSLYAETEKEASDFEITPSVLSVNSIGDREKFEEDHWVSRNTSGGISNMSFFKKLNKEDTLEFEGRVIAGNNDYLANLDLSREGLGSLIFEFKEFRKYYDGTGGFYSPIRSFSELESDLHLDIGNFKVEGILAKEGSPNEYTLAYEREFRDGKKSLVSWGTVDGSFPIDPKIYPTFIEIDEVVNKVKLGMKHTTNDSEISAEQNWEGTRIETQKINNQTLTLSSGALSSIRSKFEDSDSDLYTTVLRYSKDLNKKCFMSLGVLYNHYIGGSIEQITDASTSSSNENHPPNPARVEQDALTILPNLSFSPFKDLSVGLGLKAEFINKNGSSNYNRDYRTSATNFTPDGTIDEFLNIKSEIDQRNLSENIQLKYSGIKNAAIYADAEFEKQFIDQFEKQNSFGPNPASGSAFARDTDQDYDNRNLTLGCKWYPAPKINITAEYKNKKRIRTSNHEMLEGDVVSGLRGFVDVMNLTSHVPTLKLNYKPYRWVTYNLGYIFDTTVYNLRTRVGPAEEVAKYRANSYFGQITLAPYDYFYFSLFYENRNAFTRTRANGDGGGIVRQPIYDADFDTLRFNCSYALSKATTIEGGYSMYRTNDFNDFSEIGLPLGVDNFGQDAFIGLRRALNKNSSVEFKYGYARYDEDSNNNIDDYEAHLFSMAMNMKF